MTLPELINCQGVKANFFGHLVDFVQNQLIALVQKFAEQIKSINF